MATDGRSNATIETSVLVNFLKIDRMDLLATPSDLSFPVIVDIVSK